MFEGDLDEGELEIGQVSAMISKLQTVNEVVQEIIGEYNRKLQQICASFQQF
jgi:enoyl-[acyl-carrier protein] reductase II